MVSGGFEMEINQDESSIIHVEKYQLLHSIVPQEAERLAVDHFLEKCVIVCTIPLQRI